MPTQYADSQFSATSIGDAPEADIIARDVQQTENEAIAEGLKKGEFSAATIKKLIENFNSTHQELHKRMDGDMALYELEDFELDIYSDSMTFNEPRHMGDMVVQLCSGSILNLTIETEEKDEDINTIIEQFHLSMIKSADEWLSQMLLGRLKSELAFFGAIRGWMVLRVTIFRDNDGNLVPCIMVLDPRHIKWGVGMGGFVWVAYETWRTAEEILLDYGIKPKGDIGKITDFWSGTENVILCDDVEIPGKRIKHNVGCPPFVIHPCSNQPRVVGDDISNARKHLRGWGESIYAANRKLYPVLNKILSIWLSLIVKGHNPGGFIITDDDQVQIESTPWGKGQVEKLPIGSEWVPVQPADVAKTTPELFGQLAAAIQRGGISWVTYGQLWKGQELSGNALEELRQGLSKIVQPILEALGVTFQRMSRMVEDQFMSYDTAWNAIGWDTKGDHFFRAIEPDDISSNHEIRFEFLSITPQEESANIAKAQMLKESGIGDDEFINKEIMKFKDPAGIEDRKLIQQGKVLSQKINYLEMIKAFRKRGETMYADILSAELEKIIIMEQMQTGMVQQEAQQQQLAALPGNFQPNAPQLTQGQGQPRTLLAGPPQ